LSSEEKQIAEMMAKYVDSTQSFPQTRVWELRKDENIGLTPDEVIVKFGKAHGWSIKKENKMTEITALFYFFHSPSEDTILKFIKKYPNSENNVMWRCLVVEYTFVKNRIVDIGGKELK
jgi:hypothetical protein